MGKKYLFPFEKEKKNIPWREIFIGFIGFYTFVIILGLAILKTSSEENANTMNSFFQTSPDLIVVPTGDLGRIPKAVELAKKFSTSNIFITGVYKKNSVDMIIPKSDFDQIDLNLMEIDYWARNTIENVISTLKFIGTLNNTHKILIVSSDYHIYRLKMIFQHFTEDNQQNYQFYYFGVENSYRDVDNLIKLHKEIFKLIRGWLIMKLWTPEISIDS